MTIAALFHRAAMGGKKELSFFNLGSVPSSEGLSQRVKALMDELELIEFEELKDKLGGLSVFDMNKVTTCITLLATEVAPPAEEGHTYKFNKRIGSSSFDAALKRKPQSRREASLRKSAAAAKKAENEAAASKKVEEEAASASAKKVEEESNEQSNKQEVVEVQDFNDLALMEPTKVEWI